MYNAQEWQNKAAHARYLLTQRRMNLRISAEECEQLRPLSQVAQLYGSPLPYDDDDDDDDDDIQALSAEEC